MKSQQPWITYCIRRNILVDLVRTIQHVTLYPTLNKHKLYPQLHTIYNASKSPINKDSKKQLGDLRKACIAKLNAKEHLITTINKCLTPTKANVESLLVVFFILHMVRFEDNKVQRRHHFPKGWHFGCTSKTRDIKNTPRNMPVLAAEIETTDDNLVRID